MITVGLAQASEIQITMMGNCAFKEGKSLRDCPFEEDHPGYKYWVGGYFREKAKRRGTSEATF